MSLEKMNAIERHSALTLASIMSLRMLGLFMVLPVFSLYARQLIGATPALIGLSMGIYGLTQAFFQIPFGAGSDKFGRKRMITLGLMIFATGSIVCALTHTIWGMMIGRALQGAGAVGSTVIALMADLTRENQRSKAMAIIGMTIGMSFSLAMLLGPLLTPWLQVNGLFGLAAGFAGLAVFILYRWVPKPAHFAPTTDATSNHHSIWTLLKRPELARLNIGIFILHAIFTASFVVLPISLQLHAHLAENHQWWLYLPALLLAFACSIPCIILAEKKQRLTFFFLGAILMLGSSEVIFWQFADSLFFSAIGLFLFFTGFSVLEAFLPSLVSKTAPKNRKGAALGIYSCSQFFGIFVGGSLAGWLYGKMGLTNVYLFCTILAILWATLAFRMKNPQHRLP